MTFEKGKLFTNLEEIALNKEMISNKCENGKWRKIPYRTAECRGQMLIAAESIYPDKITFLINLQGWYHIYLCFINMRSDNYTYVKLSDDLCYTGINGAYRRSPREWCTTEYVEELYWKSADLTNQKIIMAKPHSHGLSVSGLVWIRCVPMTDKEIKKYEINNEKNRCIQMHIDEDSYFQDSFETDNDYLIKLFKLKDTNVDFCSLELSFDYDRKANNQTIPLWNFEQKWMDGDYAFDKKKDCLIKKYVEFAHENQIQLYAANRMEVGNFHVPYNRPNWNKNFVDDNPQFYCRNRDGSIVAVCSYAYEEVQDYVINHLCKMLEYDFDGVSLIFHRGMHIGFEEPVLKRFVEKYPNVEPHLLPASNPMLHEIWCEFMNAFMRKLRSQIDKLGKKHLKINVITDYSLQSSKNWGLNVEAWAKSGLADSVSQADMETYEDLSGCMSNENPDVIDMEKYQKQLANRPIIRRKYGTNVEKVCKHIAEYQNLSNNYGIEVYHILPWVHNIDPRIHTIYYTEYDEIVDKMKQAGAKKFLNWNANHMMVDLPEWHTVSQIGNERDSSIILSKYYRVLELGGSDISHFNPNWRG